MSSPTDLYLKNFEATVKSGEYFNLPSYKNFDKEYMEEMASQPMEALPPMPMEREGPPVNVQAAPVVQDGRLGANVNANAPVGDGNLNLNAALVPGNSRMDANYNLPVGRGNLDVNASVARGGLDNVGVAYGQPMGNGYVSGDAQYAPGRGMDVGVNYQGRTGGLGLRYQPKDKAVMLNATKRF